MGLACDPTFSRLKITGDEHSEINGLGILWSWSYQGEPMKGELEYSGGIAPFVMYSGSIRPVTENTSGAFIEGLQFPESIHPDFTQSDTRMRYVARVRLPDGTIEGAVISFTLQRAYEGYRPVDLNVEPLTNAERQTMDSDLNAKLPFPTLSTTQIPPK